MKNKENMRLLTKNGKNYINLRLISIILIVAILVSIFLLFTWNRYQEMAETAAKELGRSIEALLHMDHHMEDIEWMGEEYKDWDKHLIQESLIGLVENTELVHYAYILKEEGEGIKVIVDSSDVDSIKPQTTMASCEASVEINRLPFESGESFVTKSISTSCGDWIRVLTPIFDWDNENIVAVLGLSYSTHEWYANIWKKMIPDIIVVLCLVALALAIINLFKQNSKRQNRY